MDERMEFIATSNAFFVGANPIDYSGVQQAIRKLEKASQKILLARSTLQMASLKPQSMRCSCILRVNSPDPATLVPGGSKGSTTVGTSASLFTASKILFLPVSWLTAQMMEPTKLNSEIDGETRSVVCERNDATGDSDTGGAGITKIEKKRRQGALKLRTYQKRNKERGQAGEISGRRYLDRIQRNRHVSNRVNVGSPHITSGFGTTLLHKRESFATTCSEYSRYTAGRC
ncbi:uncharacterized protein F5891DRAFT_1172792 [Suillus fuscotomentosus]|uniref:Uncharacterized protein n=1 Tax=Suillus fuscotomentosus TaxID=1912939 RepID=A0AAD4HLE2_9AGAM|nr:uncharacterized protein F5891DRAFT_1172792 [Suillus fuscotomentosus]KAG1900898.1 hypothetical protein F5891DRAFT_1172792 [Suillus fuscotomentosus]